MEEQQIWKQVLVLQAATKKEIEEIEQDFDLKLERLKEEKKKRISACTKNYGKSSFPLLVNYKAIGKEISQSPDPNESLNGFILLLLISENLFFRDEVYLNSSNDRETINAARVIDNDHLKISISTRGDGANLFFEIGVNLSEVFDKQIDLLTINGRFFIHSTGGPSRSGEYDHPDALKRVLDILKYHFKK